MDFGEVVEMNHSYFALTTPSPPSDNATRLELWADPPLLNRGGETFAFHFHVGGLICFCR
jgi:hypothetical protein